MTEILWIQDLWASHFNEKTLNGYEILPRCLSSFAISHVQSLVPNEQVFVLIPRLLIIVIIIFLFVHSDETGRNSWGGSCKEEFIVKKADIICYYGIRLLLFTWYSKHILMQKQKNLNHKRYWNTPVIWG